MNVWTCTSSTRSPRPNTSSKPGGSTIINAARTARSATWHRASLLDNVRSYRPPKKPSALVKNCLQTGPTSLLTIPHQLVAYPQRVTTSPKMWLKGFWRTGTFKRRLMCLACCDSDRGQTKSFYVEIEWLVIPKGGKPAHRPTSPRQVLPSLRASPQSAG